MSTFKIFIDRLRDGQTEKIDWKAPPEFLGPDEAELQFKNGVAVKGEIYTTETHLIVHLKAATQVLMPCAVCDKMIAVDLKVDNFYHTEPVEEIRGAVFDYSEALREALLIELPRTVECNGGKCSERDLMAPFISPKKKEETHFPFANMDKDLKQ